jgi:superoxide dismutase, Fe-Mn family
MSANQNGCGLFCSVKRVQTTNKYIIMTHLIKNLEFKPLSIGYNMLEPYIDAKTMEIHHSKHHQAYYNNMIKSAEEHGVGDLTLEQLFGRISEYPDFLRNNAGGHYNHDLFWSILKLNGGAEPFGNVGEAINTTFGSYAAFREQFGQAAATRFGSGWAWLSIDEDRKLFISSTANQDNPVMNHLQHRGIPILGLDVWEHAYYLKYQNRRPEYIESFWKVVNWAEVEKNYNSL